MGLKLEEVVGKKLTEEQFDEAAGKKDACYRKVKARYDVWPSAYASGALVKCRKVGAANWGNKSKKNEIFSPMDRALKQTLKDPKSGKEVTVGSIKNQGTKRYSSSLVKKANAIFKKAMEKERAAKAKVRKMRGEGIVNEAPKIDSRLHKGLRKIQDDSYKLLANYRTVPGIEKLVDAWMDGLHRSLKQLGIMKESVNKEEKFPKSLVDKAVRIAKSMGGNMTGAVKKINSLRKGLSRDNKVAYALRVANESVNQDVFFESTTEGNVTTTHIHWESNGKGHGYTVEYVNDGKLHEAEYQGRKVKLGKIMQGDTKKFKVYVKNPKGNVVKVNFGQGGSSAGKTGGTMRIRKSNPKARANFRARHNCDNPGPRHKARYWSCRKW